MAIDTTRSLMDVLCDEYRKSVNSQNMSQSGLNRNADEELRKANHFIAFARSYLQTRTIVQVTPTPLDVVLTFVDNNVCYLRSPYATQQAEAGDMTSRPSVQF